MLPSNGDLELDYLHLLDKVEFVDSAAPTQQEARTQPALETVDDATHEEGQLRRAPSNARRLHAASLRRRVEKRHRRQYIPGGPTPALDAMSALMDSGNDLPPQKGAVSSSCGQDPKSPAPTSALIDGSVLGPRPHALHPSGEGALERPMIRISLPIVLSLLLGCGDDDVASGDAAVDSIEVDSAVADVGPDVRVYVPDPFEPTEATVAYCRDGDVDAIEARISGALAELSLEEKVSLISGVGFFLEDGSYRVAGNERLGLPGLRMLDGPRGLSQISEKTATAFPVAMMRGATWDVELEHRVGEAIGREVLSAGADTVLAPTINILRHPRWGRAQETYSEDVHHLGEMGVAFIEGVQSTGALASAKHFAVNSIENTRHAVSVELDERTLREVYLPHFRRAVQDAQVASVMSAYNQVRGQFCDLNEHLLTDILKGEWAFQGFVESDWILGTHAGAESIRAGLDLEMPSPLFFGGLMAEVAEGVIREQEIDGAVRRVLRAQLCFSVGELTFPRDEPGARETEAHVALAREVARRGTVLLKNESALPIAAGSSIALLGPLAEAENIGDTGSSAVMPSDVVTLSEGLTAGGFDVDVITILNAATEARIATADVVLVAAGLTAEDEGEATIGAGDRESLALPASQVALIRRAAELSDRVVVILEGGAAILVEEWVADVEGLVFAFYPGQEGGHALTELLSGAANFSGRLPFSMPMAELDLPVFDNVSEVVTYEYLHGYRYLEAESTTPSFPFGFGLSYAEVRYDELTLAASELDADATAELAVTITNTGSTATIETVQAYVAVTDSSVERAPQDLRAFAQVALAAGAEVEVTLEIPLSRLAYWDTSTDAWVVEAGAYEVRVGPHSGETPLTAALTIR